MAKDSAYKGEKYKLKSDFENRFISDVINVYNSISERDIEDQKEALRTVIEYIKKANKNGWTYEQIENLVLYNITNLFEVIQYPSLANFYQMRTLEYMISEDMDPYVHEILASNMDVKKFYMSHKGKYSANVKNNVLLELCGMINDIYQLEDHSVDPEYELLRQKIEKNELTIDDEKLLCKYIKLYLNELKIGKSAYWEEQKKDLEECRKMLVRFKDQIFKVEKVSLDTKKSQKILEDSFLLQDSQQDIGDKIDFIKQMMNQNGYATDVKYTKQEKGFIDPTERVTLNNFVKKPFISNSKTDNFLIIMSDFFHRMDETLIEKMYRVIVFSENYPEKEYRNQCRDAIYSFFKTIGYCKNMMHAKEHLLERLSAIMNFYKASGLLDSQCIVNNNRLSRIYLGDLKIDSDTVFSKFINDESKGNEYFIREDTDYENLYKGTPIYFSSNEAVIGMSAFYTNRMAKQIPVFAKLRYILDKRDAVKKICENPEMNLEDLDYSDEELKMYMAMYRVMQDNMIRKYFNCVPEDEYLYEEKAYEELNKKLNKYKNVYERYYPNMGFDYEKDVTSIMMDAGMMTHLYRLKEFSIKSLLYTAITDQKKNIINWGLVLEDDCTDEKYALLGFDIKSLNSPIFVHINKDDLEQFLKTLTGDTKIRMYEGANDMYSYTIKQRVTTQLLYPLSKDEKKKLLKLNGKGAITDYYKHIKWLQQSTSLPMLAHAPGSREYDLVTGQISKIKSQKQDQSEGEGTQRSKQKTNTNKNSKNKGKKSSNSGHECR